ncbi:MAG TPA: peptide ABC transporter substrate-binding protein [Candidatus Limnocylindrales bacterium]|nr:peptide ABC transporter substrate-binding protein [Candidatus Limnocylindrales bacterium]
MRRRLVGLLATAGLVIAACQPAAVTPSPASPAPSAPASPAESAAPSPGGTPNLFGTTYSPTPGQPGGQVIVADWQEANLFNPYYFNQVTEADVNTATFMGLVTSTNDFKYAPDAAEEIPTLDNGGVKVPGEGGDAMTITWRIRDGLKWSDGDPYDCADFKFSHEWIMDEANTGLPAGKTGYEDITEVECVSPTEMVWHFKNLYEGYITLFSPGPIPEHYMKDIPIQDALTGKGYLPEELPNAPVSGPFKFESITPGSELRLVRNENWKNREGRSAYLERVIFKWYSDADAMIAGYRGGEFDLAKDLNDADLPKLADLPPEEVVQLTSLTYEFLRPNWSADTCSPRVPERGTGCPMSDPAMRQALYYAIDKSAINQRLLGGNAEIAETNVSPNAWFYVPPPAKQAQDVAKAQQLLEQAGWVDSNGDGVREKDGVTAKVELCTTTRQVRQDTLALVAGWLRAIGVDATVNAVSPADIFASYNESTDDTPCNLSRGKFDVAEHAFSVPLDPLANYPVYHSSQFPPAGANDARVSDPGIDKALEDVKNNVDFSVVAQAMAEFQRIYIEKTVEVPLYFRKEVYLKNPALQNFTGNPTSTGPMWNVADWWVQQ